MSKAHETVYEMDFMNIDYLKKRSEKNIKHVGKKRPGQRKPSNYVHKYTHTNLALHEMWNDGKHIIFQQNHVYCIM